MKRLRILTKPTNVADLAELDVDAYDEKWLLRAEKIHAKQARRFRHQLAS
jgi:hypothetical protein